MTRLGVAKTTALFRKKKPRASTVTKMYEAAKRDLGGDALLRGVLTGAIRIPRVKRNKFGAVKTNGYASKLEARTAAALKKRLFPGGDLDAIDEQFTVKFACGAKYVIDFKLWHRDLTVSYVEAKGIETPVWRLKMRLLKHEFPEIHARLLVVKK